MENEEIKKLKETLATCEKEREEYLNGWKRAKADFINYQKDEAKRFEEIIKFGNLDLIRDLITILDSFSLAIAALEKDGKAEKGVYLIKTQLEDVLKKKGLEKIKITLGEQLDPALQEAIGEVDSDGPTGIVVEEIESGYTLNGRVIRPARVKISKGHK